MSLLDKVPKRRKVKALLTGIVNSPSGPFIQAILFIAIVVTFYLLPWKGTTSIALLFIGCLFIKIGPHLNLKKSPVLFLVSDFFAIGFLALGLLSLIWNNSHFMCQSLLGQIIILCFSISIGLNFALIKKYIIDNQQKQDISQYLHKDKRIEYD